MKNKMVVEKEKIYGAGVYCLRDLTNNKVLYVGSGIEMNDRLSNYLWHLKRGLFEGTNKEALQEIYDRGALSFEVLHFSEHNNEIRNMNYKQREDLQKALSVLEKMYIDLYKDTILNKQMSVRKHSSNKNSDSTYRRRKANLGNNNPNSKYSERMMAEILWLKLNGYKPREIEEMYKENGIKKEYIYIVGVTKWIHLEPAKPSFIV